MISSQSLTRRGLIKLMALASPAISSTALLAATDSTSTAPPSHSASAPHPRLFYNAASIARMKHMLAANEAAHAALIARGDALLAAELVPESVAERGGGQQANYHQPGTQIEEMGLTLGLLYHLTKDERYAAKLRDALLYYSNYVRWTGPGLGERFPAWHSELDTASFSFGFSAGYDALRGFLTPADRAAIATALIRRAIQPTLDDWLLAGTRVHALDGMGHNWWGVCVSAAGLGALALLGDEPRAQQWIDTVDAGYAQWFTYPGNILQNRMPTFERSGPSYEGVGYTNYGVSEYLHYRFAWQNTFPNRKAARLEPLEGLATFFLQTLYPTSTGFLTVNFEDVDIKNDSSATLLLLVACGIAGPDAAQYLARVRTHPNDVLLNLLRLHPQPTATAEAPTSAIYPRMGWATLRSGWQNDATMLAAKSGFSWNHAHCDAGSFILFKQGMPLIIDSGTCGYGRPEYSTYYRLSRAHNVILFNDEAQSSEDLDHGTKFPGHIHSLIDGHGLKYIYADATGPTARWFSRNYRNWLWTGNTILILDDLRAHAEGRLDWLLHFSGQYKGDPATGIALTNGPAQAVVKIVHPAVTLREESGLADHHPDDKVPYLALASPNRQRLQQFIAAICLDPAAVPQFEFLQGLNYIGVRVTTASTVEETYINLRAIDGSIHLSSAVQIGDWLTDAYLLQITRPAANAPVQRYFISDGSYLRLSGQPLIESLVKLTACWSPSEPTHIYTDECATTIQLPSDHPIPTIHWNTTLTPATYNPQTKLLTLTRPQQHE